MRRFHFVHAAGLRLNAPFAGVGRLPESARDLLAAAPLRAWDDLVSLCIERKAAFLAVAGGITAGDTGGHAGQASRLRLRTGLRRLSEHGIKTFLALSPADADLEPMLAAERIADLTIFPADRPLTVKVERGGAAIAAVCGQSAGDGPIDLTAYFTNAPEGLPLIAVLPDGNAAADLDRHLAGRGKVKGAYWALGDAVEPSRRGFAPWVVESGTLQARGGDGRERGARGAMLAEVEGDRVLAVDLIALDGVRYAEVSFAARYSLDDALLCHQIMDELNRLRAANAGRALIVDVILDGRGAKPLAEPGRAAEIVRRVRSETASWDPFVWCAKVRPARPKHEGDATNEPLAQAIVQESRALLANPLQRSYSFARRFDPLMRRWTSELETGDAERLIADATSIALAAARTDAEAESGR